MLDSMLHACQWTPHLTTTPTSHTWTHLGAPSMYVRAQHAACVASTDHAAQMLGMGDASYGEGWVGCERGQGIWVGGKRCAAQHGSMHLGEAGAACG